MTGVYGFARELSSEYATTNCLQLQVLNSQPNMLFSSSNSQLIKLLYDV